MAVLYITEYASLGGQVPAALEPALAIQTVAIGATALLSAAFNLQTRIVRLHSDTICSVKFGPATPSASTPVATANTTRLATNQTEYFTVGPEFCASGAAFAVSVITNS